MMRRRNDTGDMEAAAMQRGVVYDQRDRGIRFYKVSGSVAGICFTRIMGTDTDLLK